MGLEEFAAQIRLAVERARAEQAAAVATRSSNGQPAATQRTSVKPTGRPTNATLAAADSARSAVTNDARRSATNDARIAAAGNLGRQRSPAVLSAGMPIVAPISDVADAPAPLVFDRGILDVLPGVVVEPQQRTLLTDFTSGQGLLAGIVLSEALAPPIALRGAQPFDRIGR